MPSAPGEKLSAHSATPQLIGDSGQFEPEVAKDNAQVQGSIIHSGRAFLFIAPEMRCLNIVRMVISPRPSHSLGILVVWHDVVVIRELLVADGADAVLFGDFPLQKFPHFRGGSEFAIPSRVVRIINAPNTRL